MRGLLRTVAPVLTFSVLTLAACSTTSGNLSTSSGALASATAVGAALESGSGEPVARTLRSLWASSAPGFTELSQYTSLHEKFVPLQGPHLGDESISFDAMRDVNGVEFLDRYDYVRVGAATVLIRQIDVTAAVPPVVPTLLAPQVAKLKAAQS